MAGGGRQTTHKSPALGHGVPRGNPQKEPKAPNTTIKGGNITVPGYSATEGDDAVPQDTGDVPPRMTPAPGEVGDLTVNSVCAR